MIRTANPALSRDAARDGLTRGGARMTISGTVTRSAILLVLATTVAMSVWAVHTTNPEVVSVALWGGMIVGFGLAMVTIFKQTWAPYTAPLYALAEGAFLGGITTMYELSYPGLAFQAVGLTSAVFFALLGAYATRIVEVTPSFRSGVVIATGGIFLFYVLAMVLGFFGVSVPFLHSNGLMGIGFSIFVVGIAAMNLLLDFDTIERAARQGAPKSYEWYGAFALLVTLVWLYIEILRLLSRLQSRD